MTQAQVNALWDVGANLARGLLVFVLVLMAARFLRGLATKAMERRDIRPDAVLLVSRTLYAAVIGLGAFLFLSQAIGNALVGVSGFLVAAISTGLGLQDLFKNYVSGFYVLMEHNFRVGDYVEVGGYRGVITEVRMRVTYLQSPNGGVIVVPNSELFNKTVAVSPGPPEGESPVRSGVESAEDDPDEGVEVVTD